MSVEKRRPSFSPKYWAHINHLYRCRSFIGQGAFGVVVKARTRSDDEPVAIKIVEVATNSPQQTKVEREIEVLSHLQSKGGHPNVVGLRKIMRVAEEQKTIFFIIMDFVPYTLEFLLSKKDVLDEEKVEKILTGLLNGLSFVHRQKVMHRDIKPCNILIDKDYNIKICDFGLARFLPEPEEPAASKRKERRLSKHVVTRAYRAPEIILLEREYSTPIDIWSAGCILGELMKAQSCYAGVRSGSLQLFTGTSCFPLSPMNSEGEVDGSDQLRQILLVLGRLDTEDKAFVTTNRQYLQSMEAKLPERVDLREEFFLSSTRLVTALGKMLEFNPSRRSSAAELLSLIEE